MSDIVLVGQSFDTLDVPPALESYTKVLIHVGTATDENGKEIDLVYRSPNIPEQDFDNLSGSLMEITLPWATQDTADALYNRIVGHEYQPYELSGAVFDPAAEIGDGIEAGDMYSVLASHDLNMTSLSRSDSAAPAENESDIEFPQLTAQERSIQRKINTVQASLLVDIDDISATVESTSGAVSNISVQLGQIAAEVDDPDNGLAAIRAQVTEQGSAIDLVVDTSGAQASIKIESIVDGINDASSSVKIAADHIMLDASTIQATGVLTWRNVQNKPDVLIDGDDDTIDYITEITENTITAEYINALDITAVNLRGRYVYLQDRNEDDAGVITITDANTSASKITINSYGALDLRASDGSFYIYSKYGAIGSIRDGLGDWISVNATLSSNSNGGYDLGFLNKPWHDLYLVNEPTLRSDRRAKNSIDYDLSGLEKRYLRLRPCSYKRNGTEETSFGFIAQDVDEVLGEGYSIVSKPDADDGLFALKLEQLIALNTHMIQKLWKKVDALEQGRNQ